AYLGSEIIRPRLRAHRRSVKKLYVELGIAPWERPALPLVRDGEGGEALALGDRAGVRGAGGEWRRLVISAPGGEAANKNARSFDLA
ncbi:MAG: tRNA lysidine(34) synthetase TilS, partial [Succinivibrionaceae bacterium]|nr:tRNA lysidine(34) synthetase TilS [Succinivibrionaceae bacterium]